MARRIPLMTLLGFQIRFDLTWLILVALIIWSLSAGYFPAAYADLPVSTYFWMGVLGAIGLFTSIVLHELAHAVVGRRLGLEIHGITLFVFGGAAEMVEEPKSARTEFLMAIAGPVASLALAGIFHVIALLLEKAGTPDPISGVIGYLAGINVILAVFNLLPAFPLDGGRVLRAALWAWRGSMGWATRVAAAIGGAFGLLLVFLGIASVLWGDVVGGMWLFLIGLFIRAAASSSYQQLIARRALQHVPIGQLMNRHPVTVPSDVPVARAVEAFLAENLEFLPVVSEGRVLGGIGLKEVKSLTPEQRAEQPVGRALAPLSSENSIGPEADAAAALAQMQRTGLSRLLVVEDGKLKGVLSLKDLLRYLALRSELDIASTQI
jgi:Zn-dependent protease/predicted transcriptional regulator